MIYGFKLWFWNNSIRFYKSIRLTKKLLCGHNFTLWPAYFPINQSQSIFIYIAPNYNKSHLKALYTWSRSKLYSSLQDIYTTRVIRRAHNIIKDNTHPQHRLFTVLPSERHYRSVKSRTARLSHSFYPQAIRLQHTKYCTPHSPASPTDTMCLHKHRVTLH